MMKMIDPYEPTPMAFHNCVTRKLNELQRTAQPIRRPWRMAAALVACLVLLGGTAIALERLGVLYFLTERIWMGDPVDSTAVVQPVEQHCDSALLDATVQDAYWDGETLSVSLHVQPKEDYAFFTETDVGQDGESFDMIWWKGEILPFENWKAGRPSLMLYLPQLMQGEQNITASWDWVQNGQGETMLIEGRCADLTQGASFTLVLTSQLEGADAPEQAALIFTLPPMEKGEAQAAR